MEDRLRSSRVNCNLWTSAAARREQGEKEKATTLIALVLFEGGGKRGAQGERKGKEKNGRDGRSRVGKETKKGNDGKESSFRDFPSKKKF